MHGGKRLLALAGLLMALAGCKQRGNPYLAAAKTRHFQVGDRWNYTVKAKIILPDALKIPNMVPREVAGTQTDYVTEAKFKDAYTLALVDRAVLDEAPEFSEDRLSYIAQGRNGGVVTLLGDNRGRSRMLRQATPPGPLIPGEWASNQTQNIEIVYDNGDMEKATLTVTGTEVVPTPIGKFQTWVVEIVEDYINEGEPIHLEAKEWWVPQLGNYVKATGTLSLKSGLRGDVSLALTSTTVPLEE